MYWNQANLAGEAAGETYDVAHGTATNQRNIPSDRNPHYV